MKYKRNLIIILIGIFIYVLLNLLYNNIIIKSNENYIFVLKEDMLRGNEISIDNLKRLTIKEGDFSTEYITDISILNDKVLNFDVSKGQIIINEMLIAKDEYVKSNKDEEIISIKIKSSEDSSSYKIGKDSFVNIYYTGKTEYTNELLKDFNTSNVVSGGKSGYITTELLKNIKIINVYDKYGNQINTNNLQNSNDVLIDTIMISTSSKMAMLIYNLSRYGDFNISVLN